MLATAGIAITAAERDAIEVARFGLGDACPEIGLQILVYENNDRYCAKELVLFPGQTCPEHRHPALGVAPGKMETFRCRWGVVYLHVPGSPAGSPVARVPRGREAWFTAGRELVLSPGEQHTVMPGTWHWFQAGPGGAIISEFSSSSTDERDEFRDPGIRRHDEPAT